LIAISRAANSAFTLSWTGGAANTAGAKAIERDRNGDRVDLGRG
jgi:hypothetical protein